MKTIAFSGKLLAVMTLAISCVALIHPAKADDDRYGHPRMERHWEGREMRHDYRDWREHEMRARHWHRYHREPVPGVVYAPPPVIYPPPPPSPGINFVIPLDFR